MSDITVSHNSDEHRYEAWAGPDLAGFAEYTVIGNLVQIPHTEVEDAFGGRGVGSQIARFALDDVRDSGRFVVPLCPFIAGWIQRHPEYSDLVFQHAE